MLHPPAGYVAGESLCSTPLSAASCRQAWTANDGVQSSTLSKRLGCGVFVASDELLVEYTVIRVSDHDRASVAVCGAQERHPSRIVERFASNSRVLVRQFDIPTARRVAIDEHGQGNVRSHNSSILPCRGSCIR